MPWVRLDEDFASHPKVLDAGPLGMALQVAALCYANRHLTDGRIPRAAARSLLDFEGIAVVDGMSGDDVDAGHVIGLLVDAGLWHEPGHDCEVCPEVERGYVIHDYLEQQPSRAEVLAKREQTAAAGRKGGQARAKRTVKRNASETPSDPSSESPSETEANAQAKVQAKSKPGPVPVPEDQTLVSRKRATTLPDGWTPEPEPDLIRSVGGDVAARRELAKFRDYWVAQPGARGRKKDWQATWRNWLRNAEQYGARASPQEDRRASSPVVGSDEWAAREEEQAELERRVLGDQG